MDVLAPGENVVAAYVCGPVLLSDGISEFTRRARWSSSVVAVAEAAMIAASEKQPRQVLARLPRPGVPPA
jgi:hypothetical protein